MFYFLDGERKVGPVDKQELLNKISSNTLVWRKGFKDWIKAKDVDELKHIITDGPPLTPNEKKVENINNLLSFDFLKIEFWVLFVFVMLFCWGVAELLIWFLKSV